MPIATLPPDALTPAGFALIVASLFALCLALALAGRWLALRLRPLWQRLERRHGDLIDRLPSAAHPVLQLPIRLLQRSLAELAMLTAAGLVLLASGALFIELVEEVIEPERLAQLDRSLFAQLQALRQPWLDAVMVAITELGGVWVTLPLVLAVAGGLWATGRRAAAAYWIGAQLASRLSVVVLKATLGRDRPVDLYHGWEAYSVPSGHATTAMVTYGLLWVLLGQGRPWPLRCALLAGAALLVGLIGASRLYLGVHWLSDVIAGFALGLAWVALLAVAYRLFHGAGEAGGKAPVRRLAALVLAVLAIAWGWRCWQAFPQLLQHYRPTGVEVQAGAAPCSWSRSCRFNTLPLALRGSGSRLAV